MSEVRHAQKLTMHAADRGCCLLKAGCLFQSLVCKYLLQSCHNSNTDLPDVMLQLASTARDAVFRARYLIQAGMPKWGPWTFKPSSFSQAVFVIDEPEDEHVKLNENLAAVGSGSFGSVT